MLDLRGKRNAADFGFRWLSIGAAALVLLVLGMIALVMTSRAWPVLEAMGVDFFTSKRWSPANELYGALPFVWGTLYTALIAVVLAVPISLGVALFITQVAPLRLRRPLVYLIDLL